MSDLVGNPEDRFSHVAAHCIQYYELGLDKILQNDMCLAKTFNSQINHYFSVKRKIVMNEIAWIKLHVECFLI